MILVFFYFKYKMVLVGCGPVTHARARPVRAHVRAHRSESELESESFNSLLDSIESKVDVERTQNRN